MSNAAEKSQVGVPSPARNEVGQLLHADTR
jgi:hypothetical protein